MKQEFARPRAHTPLAIATALLDHLPFPALISSANGLVIYANREAHSAFRFGADKLNGKSVHDPTVFGFVPGTEGRYDASVLTAAIEGDFEEVSAVIERAHDRQTFTVRTVPLRLGETVAYALLYGATSHFAEQPAGAEISRTAIETEREEARRAMDETRFLEKIAELSLTGLESRALAQRIVDDVARRFQLRACSIWVANPDRSRLIQLAQNGFAAPASPTEMQGGADGVRAFIRGETIVRPDTSSRDVPAATAAIINLLGPQPRSYVVVPLEVSSRRVGIMALVWPEPRDFPPPEIERLEAIAGIAALGLHRALLDVEITTEAAILSGANRILDSALSAPSEEELGLTCIGVAETLTESQFGFVAEYSGEDTMRLIAVSESGRAACDMPGTQASGDVLRAQGIYGHVLETGTAYFTNDPARSPYSAGTPVGHPALDSFLAVPLSSGNRTVGIIAVGNRIGGYGEEHVRTLSALAPSIRSALMRRRTNERLRRSSQLLAAHLENSPVAVVEFDADWRIVQWSREAERMFGYTAEEMLGRHYRAMPFVHEEDISTKLEVEAYEKDKVAQRTAVSRNYRKDGTVIWCEWHSSAIYDDSGRLTSILSFGLDITDRRLAEEASRLTLMRAVLQKDVAAAITSSTDSRSLAERVLGIVRSQFGARAGAIFLTDDPADRMTNVVHFGYEPTAETDNAFLRWEGLGGQAIRDHTLRLTEPTAPDADEARACFGVEQGRLVAVPISVRNVVIGLLGFALEHGTTVSEEDLRLYEWSADQLNVGFENVRLYEAEHRIAETLQETLVVGRSHVDGIAFSRAYETATLQQGRVGGDFMDVFEVQGRMVAVVIGDVSGKGIDAAVVTSLVRNAVRAHLLDGLGLRDLCEKTNRLILRFTRQETFVTMFVGLLNTRSGVLHYVAAGHPEAIILSPDGVSRTLPVDSPLLGAIEDIEFVEQRAVIARDDRLILYTDGVTEARPPGGGSFFESAGLRGAARQHAGEPIETIAHSLMKEVLRFSEGLLKDDAALLVVQPIKVPKRHHSAQTELALD